MSKNPISRTAPLAALLLALVPLILAGCEATPKNYVEYWAKSLSIYTGEDDYEERYQLYYDGTYERYIYGTYMGNELKSRMYGTLFETGTYDSDAAVLNPEDETEEEASGQDDSGDSSPVPIKFHPQKQYDFDRETLVVLGVDDKEYLSGRVGTVSSESLTVYYTINLWVKDNSIWGGRYVDKIFSREFTRR